MRGKEILGEAIHVQRESCKFGGILPPVAQAFHREHIERVVEESLKQGKIAIEDVDAIAVTNRPGLRMCLSVGLRYAKHLARKHQKPVIPIHHMEAHALTARIEHDVEFPYLTLLVSGGHCLLAVAQSLDKFLLLGETVDDAPGEAFDKTARYLKLSNMKCFENKSGGQSIEEAANLCHEATNKYQFPLMMSRYRDCQFSFAGIKNTARKHIRIQNAAMGLSVDEVIPDYPDFCANFLGAVARHLCHRTQRAMEFCERNGLLKNANMTKTLVVSGGVACNDFLFKALSELCILQNYRAIRPSRKYCTDNGIMIAWNGVERFVQQKGIYSHAFIDEIEPETPCQLGESLIDEVKNANIVCKWEKIPCLKTFARSSIPSSRYKHYT